MLRVKLGYNSTTNEYSAIKLIKHSHPQINMKIMKREAEILTSLRHTNIVKLLDFMESADYIKKNGQSYKVVAIVLESVPGGELLDYIKESGRFSEQVARTYFRTLIESNCLIYIVC